MSARAATVASAAFALWFGASVVGQRLWRRPGRSRWDRLHLLIPDWRFFAPDPGVYDHHLLLRGRRADGHDAAWEEITDVEPRRIVHAAWHPSQRAEKAVFDVCAELFRFVEDRRRRGVEAEELARSVQLSVAYLTLLTFATARASAAGLLDVQFMIAISGGYDDEEPEMVFVSERHPVDARRARQATRGAAASTTASAPEAHRPTQTPAPSRNEKREP